MAFKFVQVRALEEAASDQEGDGKPQYDAQKFLDFTEQLDPKHAKLLAAGDLDEIDRLFHELAASLPPVPRRILAAISGLAVITAQVVSRNPKTNLRALRTILAGKLPSGVTIESLLEHPDFVKSTQMAVAFILAADARKRRAHTPRALLKGVALLRMAVSDLKPVSLLKPVAHGELNLPPGPAAEEPLNNISRTLNDLDEVDAFVRVAQGAPNPKLEHLKGLGGGRLGIAVQRIEAVAKQMSLKGNISLDGVRQILHGQADVLKRGNIGPEDGRKSDICGPKNGGNTPPAGPAGDPASNADLPRLTANVRVLGRGDLMLVRRETKRYQLGDIAHIENIMAGSGRSRTTEVETETIQETEQFNEEFVETSESSTETNSMNIDRATEEIVTTQAAAAGQASMVGGYGTPGAGPFSMVSVGAEASYSSGTERSNAAAVSFAKSVTEEASKRVRTTASDRRLSIERRKTSDVVEQTFDNASGDHINGVYRWVDKVEEFQIYNYGEHLLLEMIVPEPATQFLEIGTRPGGELIEPPVLDYTADELTTKNYLDRAAVYGVTGLEPPPAFQIYVAETLTVDPAIPQRMEESEPEDTVHWAYAVTGKKLNVPDGYSASTAYLSAAFPVRVTSEAGAEQDVEITFGTIEATFKDSEPNKTSALSIDPSLQGPIPISMATDHRYGAAVSVRVACTRTETTMQQWRQGVYDQIAYAYRSQKDEYDALKRQKAAFAGTSDYASNSAMNREVEQRELKRACQTLLTDQHFDYYGALDFTGDSTPRIDVAKVWSDAQHIQFFEECFQWEHMAHFLYPYQWAGRSRWATLLSRRSDDQEHQKFLQAGAARVVLAVRPGYEGVVGEYLRSGKIPAIKAEPWRQAEIKYPPVAELIAEANGRPGDEVAVGEPWETVIPTLYKFIQTSSNLNDIDGDQ